MGKPKARRKAKKARYKAITQEDKIVKAAHADKEDAPSSPTDTASSGSPTFTLEQLLSKCQDLLDCYDYDLAQKFVHRALEMDPDCVRALEYAATLLIEAGDVENARHCLGRAVTVEAESGHRKYFSLAQIMSGKEALQLYQKGIDIIAQEQKRKDGKAAAIASDLKRELSNGFCAVAELYMTDLCDEDGAQGECESHVARAVGSDEGNPEAWQTKARLSLVMEQFEDAKESARKSLSLWLPKFEAVRQNKTSTTTGEDEAAATAAAAATVVDPVEVCPLLYTTRISTAKLLIELEMLDEATQVLEGLVDEDDEVVETWYLLGWLNRIRSTTEDEAGYDGNVRFYLGKAKEVHKKNPTDDADMVRHIDEILAEVGPGDSNKDEEEEEGWEDVESSGEEDDNGDGEDGKMDET